MYHGVTRKPVDNEEAQAEAEDEAPDSPRKERVLHTRVPAVLEEELKRFAKNLRVPVSNVVRAILEDALKMADRATGSVEDRLKNAVEVVHNERETIQSKLKKLDPLDDVIAFQPLVVALPTECTACQTSLRRGESGWLGMTPDPKRRVIVCGSCLPKPDSEPTKEPS